MTDDAVALLEKSLFAEHTDESQTSVALADDFRRYVSRLAELSAKIGADRTASDILPFIKDLQANLAQRPQAGDDELFLVIAEQLGEMASTNGLTANLLIEPLITIATTEETVVRDTVSLFFESSKC